MRVLDVDMDYFMRKVACGIPESEKDRLCESEYGREVWSEQDVRRFLENNLGLSKRHKIRGRVVSGHNESLFYWRELIERHELTIPFEVVHVDSHADLGLGYSSWAYISDTLLTYPVAERPEHSQYRSVYGHMCCEGIGDYLLFAVAYRWVSNIVYCGNPCAESTCYDYISNTLKNFEAKIPLGKPIECVIQLMHNGNASISTINATTDLKAKQKYISESCKEPEVPMLLVPTVDDVKFDGKFDFATLAQSPNYTPASADYIMDIFREYIIAE